MKAQPIQEFETIEGTRHQLYAKFSLLLNTYHQLYTVNGTHLYLTKLVENCYRPQGKRYPSVMDKISEIDRRYRFKDIDLGSDETLASLHPLPFKQKDPYWCVTHRQWKDANTYKRYSYLSQLVFYTRVLEMIAGDPEMKSHLKLAFTPILKNKE